MFYWRIWICEDTIPMLHVFDSLLNGGRFVSSEFTEILLPGIGFVIFLEVLLQILPSIFIIRFNFFLLNI